MRVFSKFEAWQHNFLVYFSEKLNQSMREIDFDLIRAIQILEQSFDFSSTSKMLQFILNTNNFMQDLESLWKQLLSIFEDGQKVLTILRFKFPQDWLYAEQLENHLSEIATLITRKSATISDHLELIQPRLTLEAKRIDEAIQNLNQSWQIKKPISGDLLPNVAIETLHKFEDSCAKLELERNSLLRASQFIDLHIVLDEYVNDTIEEVKDLLSVWLSLDGLWEGISSLRTTKWDSISSTRSLRLKLDELLAIARSLPTKTRQYSAFNTVQDIIKSHIRNHSMLTELKGNAMKARHWKILSKSLSLRGGELSIETLTIGQVWDMNLSVNEQLIRSVLNQAQMELTLEENLSSIRNTWGTITFEMFNYQNNRCRLIKNWDKLFDQCNSDLSSLLNMKNSAFYFNFEQEAVELEGKLTRFFHLMDTWVDVQREWVYLDGVFVGGNEKNNSNNSDIANLLPLEYSRFNNLSHEFFAILRKANKFPLAIEVLSIQEIQKVMERTFESLKKVRRSLSDYLEKQRELFPRFYFIGNEDLLQIIGSGNNTSDVTSTINLHIKKMFSGIMRIAYSPESSCISGIYGDLDEYIPLISPVSLIKFPKLNEWLLKLETEIRLTLSNITGRAIKILDSNLTVNFEGGFLNN